MIKKKYLFMFVFIFVLGCFGACCYAYSWVDGANPVDPDELLNYITKNAWGYEDITDNTDNIWNSTAYYDGFMNAYNSWVGARSYALVLNSTGSYIYLQISTTGMNNLNSYGANGVTANRLANRGNIQLSRGTNGKISCSYSGYPNGLTLTNSAGAFTYSDIKYAYLYDGDGGYYQTGDGTYDSSDIIDPPVFTPNGDELSYQQWGNSINNITASYLSNNLNLGTWQFYENGSDYRYNLIEIRPASTGYDYQVTGLVATNQNYITVTTNYHYVSIPTRIIKLGSFYILSVNYYVGSTLKNDNYFYYFNGGSSSGGQLVLYSGDPYMNPNEQTNTIINNQRSGDAAIIAALTDTTPPASGEEPTIDDMPSIEMEDVSSEFFSWLLLKVKEVLDYNSVSVLTIPIYNQSFTIRSDVFSLPNGVLRSFIQAGWYFIVGVPFLKYIRSTIEKLKGGNVPGADSKDDLLGNVL